MRYREAESLQADGNLRLSGVAVRYGEEAGPPRLPFRERIEPGAFGDVGSIDAILNVQHVRSRAIARTGGGGLVLTDGPDALRFAAELPDTSESRDAVTLVRDRVLRGASIEYAPLAGGERQVGGVSVVQRARLAGIGVVDSPAYVGSVIEARELRIRQDGQGLEGAVFYDTDHVISDRSANPVIMTGFPEIQERASTRKERYAPGAFSFAIDDSEREVSVLMGRDYDRPLASKRGGTVQFDDGPDALRFSIDSLPPVPYVDDFRRLLASGAAVFGVAPLFRIPLLAGASELIPEPGNPGVLIRIVRAAVLTALAIVTRAPRGNPGMVALRESEPARFKLWL